MEKEESSCVKKKIAVLGSTGSIGTSTLSVVERLKEQMEVVALAAKSNVDLLEQQCRQFSPQLVAVYEPDAALVLQKRLPHQRVVAGMEGLLEVASFAAADTVVTAMSGTMGILPTAAALKSRKRVALANKEALVSAGEVMIALSAQYQSPILPVDSEHSAIFQCLQGQKSSSLRRIILTASGGPFFRMHKEQMSCITVEQALKHPTWKMGAKISIDSSTLMNKGLEVIEAHFLYQVPVEQIEVVIHPQSVVHSLVEFVDGSSLAQLSEPSMVLPIQYALTYPTRQETKLPYLDLMRYHSLEFISPDLEKFPCLALAYHAAKEGGSLPCFMNAANEVLVHRFLAHEIRWEQIGTKLEKLLVSQKVLRGLSLEDLLEVDQEARKQAEKA